MAIRLHILGIPYTITRDEYSDCAFTGKVQRFSPMMRSRGFEVYHYGIETSQSGATKHFDLLTVKEWTELRIQTLIFLDKTRTYEEAKKMNDDPLTIITSLANWGSPLCIEFNNRLKPILKENYRSNTTDIVCIPLGKTYSIALKDEKYVVVETGIGYNGSYENYCIFESNTWLAKNAVTNPSNYWFVIPHSFNIKEYNFNPNPSKKIGFLGRVVQSKGCHIFVDIAKRFPDITFVICGPGSPNYYIKQPNVIYKNTIHGTERSDYLGDCAAVICASTYLEPFCCVAVEAQLCGTPVICADHGGFTETVEHLKTGLRCHTLADYCFGVQLAIDGKFNREYIREYAINKYDMYKIAYEYENAFNTILDLYIPEKGGWYSTKSHLNMINTTIILTSTVNVNITKEYLYQTDKNERIKSYLKSITQWLYLTSFNIVLVENSGYEFSELNELKQKYNKRFEIISFNENEKAPHLIKSISKGESELFSINYAYNNSLLLKYSIFIIKITCRFFIPELEDYLKQFNLNNYDCLTQYNINRCEMVGCHYSKFNIIFNPIINHKHVEYAYKDRTSKYNNLICKQFIIDKTQRGGINAEFTDI